MILTSLALLLAAFPVLALGSWVAAGRLWGLGMAGLAALCGGLAVAAIVLGDGATLPIPAGPLGFVLELDPLTAAFILPVCVVAVACGLCGAASQVLAPVLAGALLLTLLAGDGLTLVFGLELASLAAWRMLGGSAGRPVVSGFCLVAAMALLAAGTGVSFAAMRAVPLDGWRAGILLLVVIAGAGLHMFPVQSSSPDPAAAAAWPGMTAAGVYVLVRVLFDLAGPVTPQWWCAPPLLAGGIAVVFGAFHANRAGHMGGVLTACAAVQAGFAVIGVGLALAARGADLAPLQSSALAGAMLHVLNLSVFQTLAFIAAAAAERGAGSGVLDRLGGLIQQAPATAGCMLVAAASLAVLPPSAGFASVWMLLQAVIAAPRIGGFALQCLLTAVLAAMALGVAMMAAAMLRLIGVAFLGRPRTPRAAAVAEPALLTQWVMMALAGLAVVLGLFPAAALHLLPVERQGGWLEIAAPSDAPGYFPLRLLGLAATVLAVVLVLGWRWRLARPSLAAPWAYGFAPPPAWLPFGDPATQFTAGSLALPAIRPPRWVGLRPLLPWATRLAAWPEEAPMAKLLVGMGVLLVVSLLALSWWAAR